MTDQKQILRDWLALKEWESSSGPEIPQHVLTILDSFPATNYADDEALELYCATLSTLFNFYRTSAYRHHERLDQALIKLGTCSKQQFWRPAVAFLSMAPGLGNEAIPRWVEALQLSAEQQRQLETERFHALR